MKERVVRLEGEDILECWTRPLALGVIVIVIGDVVSKQYLSIDWLERRDVMPGVSSARFQPLLFRFSKDQVL